MEFDLATRRPTSEAAPASQGVQTPTLTQPIGPSGNRMDSPSPTIVRQAITELVEGLKVPEKPAEQETKEARTPAKWEPLKLNGRHRQMMRMILEGGTYDEIAATLGMSTQAVMLVANSDIFKTELVKLEAECDWQVIRRAEEMSNEALSVLRDNMRRARSEALRASCAEKILGIAGYSKIEKKQVAVISGEDVIRELNRRRRENAFGNAPGNPQAGDSGDQSVIQAEVVNG